MPEFTQILNMGPIGTLLYTVIAIILSLIVWKQRNWQNAAVAAKTSLDVAVAEMQIHRESALRLREEAKQMQDLISKLKASTDLAPLVVSHQASSDLIHNWIKEGRGRFDEARQSLGLNTSVLQSLAEEVREHRNAFIAKTIEQKQSDLLIMEQQIRLVGLLDELERRLSVMAVQVGLPSWKGKNDN